MAISLAMAITIIGTLFTLAVFNQYLSRRKPHQLVWTLGLLLYTAGAFLWLLREAFGTSNAVFRLWYLGPILKSRKPAQGVKGEGSNGQTKLVA
jgi:hypothetical protein